MEFERRTNAYAFKDEKSLFDFFGKFLDRNAIKDAILMSNKNFIVRFDTNIEETKLQMIKKAEFELLRMVKHQRSRAGSYAGSQGVE